MKIAIDISQIVYGTGVSVYTKELVRNLLLIDQKNNYLLFGGSLRRRNDMEEFIRELKSSVEKQFEYKFLPLPPSASDILWNRIRLVKIEALIGQIDLLHASDWSVPPTDAKVVCTVHDLVPILYPSWSHSKIVRVHSKLIELQKQKADLLITPSDQTAHDLRKLGFKNKIWVVPEAVSSNFRRATDTQIAKVRNKYNIDGRYMFAIGIGKRKNTERLINAFSKYQSEFGFSLVVAGGGEIADNWREPGVMFIGRVSDQDLPILYSGAEVFLYPSLYEGFGLPILESFACSTPVVTSNTGSMKETASDAAVLIDPTSVNSISKGIKTALNNSQKLIKKGNKRVNDFSWSKTAEMTLKLYNSL